VDDLVGTRIGQFRFVDYLGEGGMGTVYAGVHEKLGRRVALKVLRDHHRFDREARGRFLREAQILSQLSHPHICQIHDYVDGDEVDLIVLELVPGRSLRDAIDEGLPPAERFDVAEQILAAMAAAHGQGVVHRDLKPDNVMVTPEGGVKILDFGLARTTADAPATEIHPRADRSPPGSSDSFVTQAGYVTGTVDYMSPEQARGEPATPASDVYSLGLVLQELFSQSRAARSGPLPSRLEQARKGQTAPVTGVDPDLAALIERMKSLAPGSRPSAVDALERMRWIRGKGRRRLRNALVVVAVSTLVVLSILLAWQAHEAHRAADRAERAWAEAEALTAFMLEDLLERLRPLGRLDLLDQVAVEARRYYQEVPVEMRSAERSFRHGLALRTIGQVLELEGEWEDAEGIYRKVLELNRQLVDAHGDDERYRQSLQRSWDDLGDVLLGRGRLSEAEDAFRRALELARELESKSPGESSARVADAWDDLGGLEAERGHLDQAMAAFEEALKVARALAARAPEDPVVQSDLARAFHRIGTVHEMRREYPAAAAAFEESLGIDRAIVAAHPRDAAHQMNLAQALYDVARVRIARGALASGRALVEEALGIDRSLVELDPANARWRASLGGGYLLLGDLVASSDPAAAREAWLQARSVLAPLSATPYRDRYEAVLGRLEGGGGR
jgi:tetratricopeptide (TPR) repeat protein